MVADHCGRTVPTDAGQFGGEESEYNPRRLRSNTHPPTRADQQSGWASGLEDLYESEWDE